MFRDPTEHLGPDFLALVEREYESGQPSRAKVLCDAD